MKYLLAVIPLFLAAPAFADHQYPNAIKSCDKRAFWFMPRCEEADRGERPVLERQKKRRKPDDCKYCEDRSGNRAVSKSWNW